MKHISSMVQAVQSMVIGKQNIRRTILVLAALVIFIVTYLLILPAITIDKEEAAAQGGIDIVAQEEAQASGKTELSAKGDDYGATIIASEDAKFEDADKFTIKKVSKDKDSYTESVNEAFADQGKVVADAQYYELSLSSTPKEKVKVEVSLSDPIKVGDGQKIVLVAFDDGKAKSIDDFDTEKNGSGDIKALSFKTKDISDIGVCVLEDKVEEEESEEPAEEAAEEETGDEPAVDEGSAQEEAKAEDETEATDEEKGAVADEDEDKEAVTDEEKDEKEAAEEASDDKDAKATEEDGEKKDENEPAPRTFVGRVGDVNVVVKAPVDAFPENTEMKVEPVAKAHVQDAIEAAIDGEAKEFKAVDITFISGGIEVQPAEPIEVTMNSAEVADYYEPVVVHIKNNGKGELIEGAEQNDKNVTFQAEKFSIYAVVDPGNTGDYARMTVKFYNGDTLIDTMYVKNKDELDDLETILYDPGAGELATGEMFRGWTFNPNYTSADATSHYDSITDPDGLMTIEDIRKWAEAKKITENDEVNIYAMIFKHYTVSYLDLPEYKTDTGEEVSLGVSSIYLARTDTAGGEHTVSMPYAPHDAVHNFEGWKVVEGAGNIVSATYTDDEGNTENVDIAEPIQNGTKLVIKGDVTLRVNAPKGNWLIFDENGKGATYNAPQFLEQNETAVMPDPSKMSRTGYNFAGWYYNAEGTGDEFTGGTIDERTTVYAKWTPKTIAPYKVLIYKQTSASIGKETLGNNDYTLEDSIAVDNGTVGQNIPYTFRDYGDEDYVRVQGNDYHYTGFTLNAEDVNQQVTITPDGKAVLSLHFDRIAYDLKFYLYRQDTGGQRSYATQSAKGRNVWGIAGNWQNVSSANVPTTTYGPVLNEVNDGYTGYYFALHAYYGEDISSKWPTYGQIKGPNNDATKPVSFIMMNGTGLKGNGINDNGFGDGRDTIKGLITVMDENILGVTNDADGNYLIIRYASYNDWTYHIYFEAYDGQDLTGKTTKTINGKTYYLDHDVASRSSNTYPAQQNPPQYQGFRVVKNTDGTEYYDSFGPPGTPQANTSGYTVYLNYYYDRLAYQVNYHDGVYVDADGNLLESGEGRYLTDSSQPETFGEKYDFEATIPDKARNFDPTSLVDAAHQNEYVFEGWYFDQACETPYEWGEMPLDGIKVYAKWRQKQYRAFLHPNVPDESKDVDWGTDPSMSFRISYGGTVSTPEGLQEGYEMVGWYKDPECTEVYEESTKLTDSTTSKDYDKTKDWTDPIDKYGNVGSNPTNADVNRPWVTRKLDLYGKWRQVMIGAKGINVIYDAGEGSGEPTDNILYLDKAEAVTQPAPTSPPEGKVFRYWVLQKWDPSANGGEGAYVDVEPMKETVPGDTFTVLLANARQQEAEGHTPDDPKYTYTVQLRAEYGDAESLTPTHIDWFNNYVSDPQPPEYSNMGAEGKGLKINEAVDIYTPVNRPGYKFKGWARLPESVSNSRVVDGQRVADLLDQNTFESAYMYLYYIDGGYYLNADKTQKVTQVAADEEKPYHDMYAVWERLYTVTVKKEVVGSDDSMKTFEISHNYTEEGTFSFDGEPPSRNFTNGKIGTISTEIPYDTVIKVTETPDSNYTASYSAERISDEDGKSLATPVTVAEETDGGYKITGDTVITVTNTRNTQPVVFKKVDSTSTTTTLPGATFTMTDRGSATYSLTSTDSTFVATKADGAETVEVPNLPLDTYTLTEVKAPAGYDPMTGNVTVNVTAEGVTYTQPDHSGDAPQTAIKDASGRYVVIIYNNPGVALPHTGGSGTLPYTLGGFALILAAALMYGFRMRRRERRSN